MTAPADTILTDAEVHTLGDSDETYGAIAIRDGRVVRLADSYEIEFLEGAETEVIDCDGKVVLPGFVDAHTHLEMVGRHLVHADLRDVSSPEAAVDRLHERASETDGPVLGYGYDESTWDESRYLTTADLNPVTDDRPVVAFREDMHTASVNGAALTEYRSAMPDEDVQTEGGEPTGVLVEEAVGALFSAFDPGVEGTEDLLRAAQEHANALGVTGIHDMCRRSHKPRVFRDLDARDELTLRVRLNYWENHTDAVVETGLRSGYGSPMVQTGAIKTFTDGSFGGRTAKLREPYSDDESTDGQWVVDPEELEGMVAAAVEADLQFTAHAIGDAAVAETLDVLAAHDSDRLRHRIEHAELLTDDLVERFAETGVVASVQPNFLKWARDGGLYESRLGARRSEVMPFRELLDAGVPLAFGSDCMPLDPLFGIGQAVTAPEPSQRLTVTEALRAYTYGGAYAAGREAELGTLDVGKRADIVVLDESPWEAAGDAVTDIGVTRTLVDGDTVYEA
ncbi:amidohydrolase family protein [Halosegnis longus]|uniref:amidohydrolase family protein n=1 Tax=Halosegnis longus TaxID=2216012 RepID=UPI00096AB0F9|nr:amidohydrolase [Salella cibi]